MYAAYFLFFKEKLFLCFQSLQSILIFICFILEIMFGWDLTSIYVVAEFSEWNWWLIFLLQMLDLWKSLSMIWAKTFNKIKIVIISSRFRTIDILAPIYLLLIISISLWVDHTLRIVFSIMSVFNGLLQYVVLLDLAVIEIVLMITVFNYIIETYLMCSWSSPYVVNTLFSNWKMLCIVDYATT